MELKTITDRQKEILDLIKQGHCLPREIAFQLKANKSNISTALKALLDQDLVVREKFFGTYVYALSPASLELRKKQKERDYARQMKLERTVFCRRRSSM